MRSFRTEIENPLVERDIIELEKKIRLYHEGKIDEERFRSLRLARGVYGQRQPGVQMIRIKLPYGRVSFRQLRRISEVADKYSTGNLHTTTRQDIQIHYVSLDQTPELWAELERDEVTLREACGNTVRNVTASPLAGVDPDEPFDVSPYAHAFFTYFLRNPVCQEMGRKFKVSFSSSDADSAFAFIHDLGFVPRTRLEDGVLKRGFKVKIAGGLGAQPLLAQTAFDFLPEDQLIPFAEAVLRVFDRHGERSRRNKARMKYLVKSIGLEALLSLVNAERKALPYQAYPIDTLDGGQPVLPAAREFPDLNLRNPEKFALWRDTNALPQKQSGYFAVAIRLQTGDFSTDTARKLADLVEGIAADDIRITPNQGLMLRFVPESALGFLFEGLDRLGLAEPGFDSVADITTCPGTDTCNLAISNSTGVTRVLEEVIEEEYPALIRNRELKIKISGCMNSCGQHSLAHIGFHGSSIKVGKLVAPALQVMLGGGSTGAGEGRAANRVIKVPSKRGPDVLRYLLNDYQSGAKDGENFHAYYDRQGKSHFYELLKPLTDPASLTQADFVDWGQDEQFKTQIGIGECAGVVIDLVATLIFEAEEKLLSAEESLLAESWSDGIYHSYSALVNAAKALLTRLQVKTNTQAGIVKSFDEKVIGPGLLPLEGSFADLVYQIRSEEPSEPFAYSYLAQARQFIQSIRQFDQQQQHEPV